jgi:uncharacterized membrane protein
MQKLRLIIFSLVFSTLSVLMVSASNGEPVVLMQDKDVTYLAKITKVISSEIKNVPNLNTTSNYQTVIVEFLSGERKGETQEITDSNFLMSTGDKVYVRYTRTSDGTEYYSIQEPYRLHILFWLLGLFIVVALLFGGKQGILGLFALFISFGFVFKLMFPSILNGGNIIFISTLGALTALFVVMFVTHGFSRLTTAAFLGCSVSVLFTVFLAKYAVSYMHLSGFSSEESVYLNMATQGSLDFVALLVGGIIIGVIGVIDDIAITQASVVNELYSSNPSIEVRVLYLRALKVGKDHMGAVINTLILAYTGASLPLVLLFYVSETPALELINREVIATEIVRSIVGSIGLLLAVPLTTFIAVLLIHGRKVSEKSLHSHSHHH